MVKTEAQQLLDMLNSFRSEMADEHGDKFGDCEQVDKVNAVIDLVIDWVEA